MKRVCAFIFSVIVSINVFSQLNYSPVKFKYKQKDYFVYPLRASGLQSVPPTAFKLPDGDYLIFTEYEFKGNLTRTKIRLRDTTKVAGICSIKNNLPEGFAEFYSYRYKVGFMTNHSGKKVVETWRGNFVNGLKEGTWEQLSDNDGKITREYKAGLLNGYVKEFNSKGVLIKKESWKDERPCDTVTWYYANGKPHFSYDVYDDLVDKVKPPPDNFNDFVLGEVFPDFFLLGKENKIKSFYRSWKIDGTPENDIRFNHHKNPQFDTLVNSSGLKLVTKLLGINGKDTLYRVETFAGEKTPNTIREYIGHTEYLYKAYFYNEKTKSRDSVGQTQTPPRLIRPSVWKETIVTTSFGYSDEVVKNMLIPAAQYCWEEKGKKAPKKPLAVDSINRKIFIEDTIPVSDASFRVAKTVFDLNKQDSLKEEKNPPWKKFKFLNGLQNAWTGAYLSNGDINSGLAKNLCGDLIGEIYSEKYYVGNKEQEGKFLIYPKKSVIKNQASTIKMLESSRNFFVFSWCDYHNGQRDGKQESLRLRKLRKIDGNAESWFFKNAREGESYQVANYSNGVPDGNFRLYTVQNTVVRLYNKDSTKFKVGRKLQQVLLRDENYKAGEIDGTSTVYEGYNRPRAIVVYNNGKLNGKAEFYSGDGKLTCLAYFRENKLHGSYTEWNGHKTLQATFEENKLNGELISYNANNTAWMKLKANENKLVSKELFFESGSIKKEEIVFSPASEIEFSQDWMGSETLLEMGAENIVKLNANAAYKSFYENGKTLCEGAFKEGRTSGKWNFYNVAGTLINEVMFTDTFIIFPNNKGGKKFIGKITGYFNDGKLRFKGYISSWESGYDCALHQDKTKFVICYTDTWSLNGDRIMINGNGKGVIFDENGVKLAEGELKDGREESVWKYYDKGQRLAETGKFVNGEKEGLWYIGDLENINFEDGACFDANNPDAQRVFERSKKQIKVSTELYKSGILMDTQTFETNLNKTID